MEAQLNALCMTTAKAQVAINEQYAGPYTDALELAEIKKRKPRLREKIERTECKVIIWGLPATRQPSAAMRDL